MNMAMNKESALASVPVNLRIYSRVFFRQLFVEITSLILE